MQAWGQLEAAKAQIQATQAQVNAAEIALNGVREEARVGQRTTLDVLNAQQELVNARVALVTAQRDRVVASYTLLAAVGRLSPQVLGLPCRSTTRRCTTIRCATPGSACARRTAGDTRSAQRLQFQAYPQGLRIRSAKCQSCADPVILQLRSNSTRATGFPRRGVWVTGTRQMSQPAKAQEPSMEEILASIRRIIADDDTAKPAAKPAAAAPAAPRHRGRRRRVPPLRRRRTACRLPPP